jgi:hypothetical protein
MLTTNKKVFFHFLRKDGGGFDRIFSIHFFQAVAIDVLTNESLNEDLQLPTYNQGFLSIKEKLKPNELQAVADFIERERGTVKTKPEAIKKLQAEFGLSVCDVTYGN